MFRLSCSLLFCALPVLSAPVGFNRDVRPILSDKCYVCHGPDAASKKVPFRLDSEAAARPKMDEIVKRITAAKPALRMPPTYSGLKLTEAEVDTLKQWVSEGGAWQKHWSFLAPVRPDVPAGRNAIDFFISSRLEKEGLKASPEANRETLIRRVSLDLTGLPPTPAEIDAFLADGSDRAYEKVVDRLLASPGYGERMAFRWLDAARYADTNGYQYDAERIMWRWRDWVIDAFNRNQPFDRFTLDQIAGDMLPNGTRAQKIATGFNRNHRANTEDGIIPEEYAVEYVVDRVETTSTVFMGLTLGCARCHNHKYDPLTQKEFYQTFAYFNNIPEMGRAMKYGNSPPMIAAPTGEQQKSLDALNAKIASVEVWLRQHDAEIAREQHRWEQRPLSDAATLWAPASGLHPVGPHAADFEIDDPWTLSASISADSVPDGSIMSKMMDDPKGKGFGVHMDHGKVHVNLTNVYADDAIRVETERTLEPRRRYQVTVTYSGSRAAEGLHIYIDGEAAKFKILLDTLYRPYNNAGKSFEAPFRVGAGWGKDRLFNGSVEGVHVYGRVLEDAEIRSLALNEPVSRMAAKTENQRSATEQFVLRSCFLEQAAPEEVKASWKQLAGLREDRERMQRTFPTVMVMEEAKIPKSTFLLQRGAYDHPGEKVAGGVPAVLPPLPEGAPNNRLGFAKWLIDPGNPLLARVTVNRFWQMYFGNGIVKTTEDFGSQGEWPSHPELLDWLATEFIRTGWDVKAMQKLIVSSAAYRQESKATPDLLQRDPENRLMARGPRFRLSAEMIRDQALAAAGLLVEQVGGPSVKPYQPAGLWKEIAMQDMDYVQGHGSDLYRRSLYTFWKRTIAPPEMLNFDSSNRESCTVRETRTNTPLQALNLMDDVTYVEAARLVGERMMIEGGGSPKSRLRHGFRLLTGRLPTPAEEQVLLDDLRFHLDYFASKPDKVREYLSQGESRPKAGLDERELAAYASLASLLLNLDETVTKN